MTNPDHYLIEPLLECDEPILWDMLFHAIYVAPGTARPSKEVVTTPELSRYVQEWGQATDLGFKALASNDRQPVGAAWLRLLIGENRGYGYVDDTIPELSIAVSPKHRGRGVGTRLLTILLNHADRVYDAISLSVSKENPATRLYCRFGFRILSEHNSSLTMKKELDHESMRLTT